MSGRSAMAADPMSKIFSHDQEPSSQRVFVTREADGSNQYQSYSTDNLVAVAIALIVLFGGACVALYFWWPWVLLGAIAFLLVAKWAGTQLERSSGWGRRR